MYKIVKKRVLNPTMTWLTIEAPLVARKAKPGQFIIFRIDEFGERVPLTMAGHDEMAGTVDIIFAAIGNSTMLLNQLEEGDYLLDVVGPLGRPTNMEGLKKVCVVGGGTGNALAYPLATGMQKAGIKVDMVAGYKSEKEVILVDEFKAGVERLFVTTDDGSYGEKGFTTEKLEKLIAEGNQYDEIVVVGPPIMMKFVCEIAKKNNIHSEASLATYMVDGTGMCGGCRATIGGEDKFVCVDGPEFDGSLIDWDELIQRSRMFAEQEAEDRAHVCRLTGGVRYND